MMEKKEDELRQKNPRPICFGDETKFVAYLEKQAMDSECARCASENVCGEYILSKWSWESIF